MGVELGQAAQFAVQQQVGQAGTPLGVKPPPVLIGADHVGGRDPGELLAGAVPHRHPVPAVQHESGHRQLLQQVGGEGFRVEVVQHGPYVSKRRASIARPNGNLAKC